MGIRLDGIEIFEGAEVEIELGPLKREAISRKLGGSGTVVSIDLGMNEREVVQRGRLLAGCRDELNDKIELIRVFMDGRSHTLTTTSGYEYGYLRMDYLEVRNERKSGGGIIADYEIIYTQLRV